MNPNIRLSESQLFAKADELEVAGRERLGELAGVLQELSERLPNSPMVHVRLARTLISLGHHQKAEAVVQRAVTLSKDSQPDLCKWLGTYRYMQKRFADAIHYLEMYNAAGNWDPEVQIHLSEALYYSHRKTEALNALEIAREKFPSSGSVYHHLARHLFLHGRFVEAAAAAATAIKHGHVTVQTIAVFGKSKLEEGDLTAAHQAYKSLGDRLPMDESKWSVALVACLGLDKALEWYQGECQENDPFDCFHYSSLLLQAGRYLDARRVVKLGRDAAPNALNLIGLSASAAALAGDWKIASSEANILWDLEARRTKAGTKPPLPKRPPIVPKSMYRIVYIAVEVAGREFNSRLLLAIRASERNICSVVAANKTLSFAAKHLPIGIYFLKTLNANDTKLVRSHQAAGHRFVALDEEQLSSFGDNEELVIGVDPNIVEGVDLILANNPSHQSAIEEIYPVLASKVVTTGNPRLELLDGRFAGSFDLEAGRLKAEFGKTVLICTNFGGYASSSVGFEEVCAITLNVLNRAPATEQGRALVQMGKDFSLAEARSIAGLIEFVPEVAAAFPDITFVIRPHPAENKAVWKTRYATLKNVVVAPAGTLQGWLKAASAMIYFAGCMTGVEACLSGTPAIRFEADPDLVFPKCGLSAHINPVARNGSDLVGHLRTILAGEKIPGHDFEQDQRLLDSKLLVSAPSERCAAAIDDLLGRAEANEVTADTLVSIKSAFEGAALEQDRLIAQGNPWITRGKLTLSIEEISNKIASIQAQIGSSSNIRVIDLGGGTFMIAPDRLGGPNL